MLGHKLSKLKSKLIALSPEMVIWFSIEVTIWVTPKLLQKAVEIFGKENTRTQSERP